MFACPDHMLSLEAMKRVVLQHILLTRGCDLLWIVNNNIRKIITYTVQPNIQVF